MVRPLPSLGDRLGLSRLGSDLAIVQRFLEATLSEGSQCVERLPRQRKLGDLVFRQLPVGEVDRYQSTRLVVAEWHPRLHPFLEPGGVQGSGFGEQLADPQTHAVDRRVHLVLDLLEP